MKQTSGTDSTLLDREIVIKAIPSRRDDPYQQRISDSSSPGSEDFTSPSTGAQRGPNTNIKQSVDQKGFQEFRSICQMLKTEIIRVKQHLIGGYVDLLRLYADC